MISRQFIQLSLFLLIIIIFVLYTFYSCNPFLANKEDYYQYLKGPYFIPQQLYDPRKTDLRELRYPIIMKPNVCSGEGRQVSKIHNVQEALDYIQHFDRSHGDNIIIQKFSPAKYEVGVLYRRYPWEKQGRIVSLGNRSAPSATTASATPDSATDTTDTQEFVPRSCFNVDCADASEWLTSQNKKIMRELIERLPGVNVCRLDVLFDNLADFKAGHNFQIIEVNGRMGFDLANYSVQSQAIRNFYNFLWLLRRFGIGLLNVITFQGICPTTFLKHLPWKAIMAWRENNWEFLITQDYYEPSLLDN